MDLEMWLVDMSEETDESDVLEVRARLRGRRSRRSAWRRRLWRCRRLWRG